MSETQRQATGTPVVLTTLAAVVAVVAGVLTSALLSTSRCDGSGGAADAEPGSPAAAFCDAGGPWMVGAIPTAGLVVGWLIGRRRGGSAFPLLIGLGLIAGCAAGAAVAQQLTHLSLH